MFSLTGISLTFWLGLLAASGSCQMGPLCPLSRDCGAFAKCDYFIGLFHLSRLWLVSGLGVDPEHTSQGFLLALVIKQAVKRIMAREKNLKAKEVWAQFLASKIKIPRWRSHKSLPRIPIILYTSILLSVDLLSQFLDLLFKITHGEKNSLKCLWYIFFIDSAGTFSIVAHFLCEIRERKSHWGRRWEISVSLTCGTTLCCHVMQLFSRRRWGGVMRWKVQLVFC